MTARPSGARSRTLAKMAHGTRRNSCPRIFVRRQLSDHPPMTAQKKKPNARIAVVMLISFMIWLKQNELLQSAEIGGNCFDL